MAFTNVAKATTKARDNTRRSIVVYVADGANFTHFGKGELFLVNYVNLGKKKHPVLSWNWMCFIPIANSSHVYTSDPDVESPDFSDSLSV